MIDYPLKKAFELFEPGPVLLLTTKQGEKSNAMTLSWHTLIDFTPIIAVVLSDGDYSFNTLRKTRECVLAIPNAEIIETVVSIGNCSGKEMDKFAELNLTTTEAECVKPPLIADALYNVECTVLDVSLANRYGMFVLEGLRAWENEKITDRRTFHAHGNGIFTLDGKDINLKRLMTKWPQFI
ncbi:MAG: flavin reductase family protein [Helicobacteraceae bacterium]|nr:flavin reductase family protein [Helicobacteraceae bacterium]